MTEHAEIPEIPGWTQHERAIVEVRAPYGPHVIGWQIVNDTCGCQILLGMRLDLHEPTVGLEPCAQHLAVCESVLEELRDTPPTGEEIGAMTARLHGKRVLA